MSFIAPTVIDDLTRIGKLHDGGYVIPKSVVEEAEFLLSFGINEDWSFEQHFRKLHRNLPIHAYDHTISEKRFRHLLLVLTRNFCLGRGSAREMEFAIRLYWSYVTFFRGKVWHYQERIAGRAELAGDVTLGKVFERTKARRIFLKIDIEGSEYEIIDDIVRHADRIIGLVVEFHNTALLRSEFSEAVKKLQSRFEIVHVHGNNYRGAAADNVPEVLEITFLEKSMCIGKGKRASLPLPGLDSPNNPNAPEFSLTFAS